jgi:hypothetical protein
MIYLIISFIILAISFVLFKKVSGSLKITQLNMISWVFFFSLLTQSFIASILIVNNLDDHYIINKLINEDSRVQGWISVQYVMIMVPLGMLLVVRLFGYKNNNEVFDRYVCSEITPLISNKDTYIKYPLYVLSILSVLSVIYVMQSLDVTLADVLIKGLSFEEISIQRQLNSRAFQGNTYIRNILAIGTTPILTYIAYAYYKMTHSRSDLLLFIVLFMATFFILTYDFSKAPFVRFLFGFLLLNVLISGFIRKKVLLFLFVCFVLIFIFLYFFYAGITDISHLFTYNSGILGRIMITHATGVYLSFDLFPGVVEHLNFSSFSGLISSMLDVELVDRSARILMINYFPYKASSETAGVINSLFIAEAWANFGLLGVLIAPIYVGVIIQLLFMFFLKMPKTPLLLGPFAFLSYSGTINGGFNDYLYNPSYLIIAALLFIVYLTGKMLKRIENSLYYRKQKNSS